MKRLSRKRKRIIMEKKKLDRDKAISLIARGEIDRLLDFDLREADLRKANLRGANLRGADIDFSCWPLWCGSLGVRVDARIARQLAYHFCALACDDPEYIKARNAILDFANQFHRAKVCGILVEASRG